MNKISDLNLKTFFYLISAVMLGVVVVVFSYLYINETNVVFICKNSKILKIISAILSIITVLSVVILVIFNQKIIYKLTLTVLFFIALSLVVLYLLKISGFWDKIDSVEDLRIYISGYGSYAVIIFIIIQILQVVVLPIPGVITMGAGVALFGAKFGSIYSLIGILSGSFIAYYIGKIFGYKTVKWFVGKESLDKTLEKIKGKDKAVLTFMFLFPFFPDDILCFVAGMSSMSQLYFIIMITITRIISVYSTNYSLNGSIIPYNTPWGIAIWVVLIIGTFLLSVLIYKKGDKIENSFKNFFNKKVRKKAKKDF